MIVLHIAALTGDKSSGVDNVVPQYIGHQEKIAEVGLLNVLSKSFESKRRHLIATLNGELAIKRLPEPFNKPDVVIFHGIYRFPFVCLSRELKKEGVPYVIIPHGSLTSFAQKKKRIKKMIANALFFKRFISGASCLHYLSESEAKRSNCFGNQYFVCPNGVSLPSVLQKDNQKIGIRFLYLGRLEYKIKGIDILLDAIEINKTFLEQEKVFFDIYGPDVDGSAGEIRRETIKKGIANIVSVHDAVYGTQKRDVFLESDVFVLSSRTEGLPTGVLEAMSYSMPCLLTFGTSLGEYVVDNDCGWASKNDAFDLAEKMRIAVSEKGLFQEKGLNARRNVEKWFSWEHVSKELLKRYEEVVRDKSGSR